MSRRFRAPGRVNLIGEHTDYAGGLVLPAAIELGVELEGAVADATRIEGAQRYADAVEHELAVLGRPSVGFVGRITSNLPIGAGLSSSAAVEVVIAVALCAVADFELSPLDLAAAAQRAEHRASGVPCGIMDQAACVLGRAGHAILLDTGTLEHRAVPLPPDVAIVVVDSGVRRRLKHSGYETRRRELEEALAGANSELHRRRLRHLLTENARVRGTVAALEAGDLTRLGALFRAGHESLRDDYEVSTLELDHLVDLAYEHGALAARMTGGGFGGSIVALVATEDAERFAATMPGETYVTAAADGAREL